MLHTRQTRMNQIIEFIEMFAITTVIVFAMMALVLL